MSRPLNTWKEYGVQITAWPTSIGGISFSVRKSYKVKATGEYKDTNTFFEKDIENLGRLCQQAIDWAKTQGSGAVDAHWEHKPSQPPTTEVKPEFEDDDIPF